jgi:hypothetical protein
MTGGGRHPTPHPGLEREMSGCYEMPADFARTMPRLGAGGGVPLISDPSSLQARCETDLRLSAPASNTAACTVSTT